MLMFFNLEIAVRYGTYPALIGQNFWYWVNENRKGGKNFHNGRYWVYNSVSKLRQTFPNLSEYQIRHAIETLVQNGVLMKGNFNKTGYDRTTWYAFTDEGAAIFQKTEMEGRKSARRAV